jgi:CRP-like cAMP-binding protein
VIGKRLQSFINNFKLKHFALKDLIYSRGEKPKSVYFLIRGQVSFELVLEDEDHHDPHEHKHPVSTETLGEASYFG